MQVIQLQDGRKALKFRLDYILPFDELYRRMSRETIVFGRALPVNRDEVLEAIKEQILSYFQSEDEEDNDLMERLKYLFPELQ